MQDAKENINYFDFHMVIEEEKIILGYRSFYTIRNLIVLIIEIFSTNGIFSKGLTKRWMCLGHLILESIL